MMMLRSLAAAVIAVTAVVFGSVVPTVAAPALPDDGGVVYRPDVVGGSPAPGYSFMASMQNLAGGHFCGASVVHANWAVTARHCVVGKTPSSIQVRVGSNNRTSGGQLVGVTNIYLNSYDIALIKLTGVAVGFYPPIAIGGSSGPVGTPTRILGWGQTCPTPGGCGAPVMLQQLDTSIVSDGACSGIYAAQEICTGNPGGVAGACYGDSGGPQVKTVGGAWQLIGATSRSGGGSQCAVAPSIYMDVPFFRPWIQSVTGLPL